MQADYTSIYEELRTLKNDINRVKKLTEQLNEICYKLTVSYGLNTGGGSGMPTSAIENLIIKKEKLQVQINDINTKIRIYNKAIASALSPLEREIIYEIIDGNYLLQYARQKGIYKSTVYKIKDKAIYKIAKYIEKEEEQ